MEQVLVELRRIADVLERLAANGEMVFSQTLFPKLTSLNSLNSSSDSEVKSLASEKEGTGGKKPIRQNPRTSWPDGFTYDERAEKLADGYKLNVHKEFAAFRDHHCAVGSVMKDWQAAFRQWLRRAQYYASRNGGR
jgi:hypothetical protein